MQVWSNNEAIEQYRNLLNGKKEVRESDRWVLRERESEGAYQCAHEGIFISPVHDRLY